MLRIWSEWIHIILVFGKKVQQQKKKKDPEPHLSKIRIRIFMQVFADLHYFNEDPDPHQSKGRIRTNIKVKRWIRIRIKVMRIRNIRILPEVIFGTGCQTAPNLPNA